MRYLSENSHPDPTHHSSVHVEGVRDAIQRLRLDRHMETDPLQIILLRDTRDQLSLKTTQPTS